MDYLGALRISGSGLSAQQTRMNTISSNLANAETTRTHDGSGPYKRKDPIFVAIPDRTSFDEVLTNAMDEQAEQVAVEDIMEDTSAPKMVFKPDHPDANEQGYVAMPNVNVVEEMANMISTSKAFEANAQALATTKALAMKALELGRG